MKTKKLLICSIFAACLLPLIAQAEKADAKAKKKPDLTKAFAKIDTDSSGGISLEEAKASKKGKYIEKRFDKLDLDASGDLNLEEFKASRDRGSKKNKKNKKNKKTEK